MIKSFLHRLFCKLERELNPTQLSYHRRSVNGLILNIRPQWSLSDLIVTLSPVTEIHWGHPLHKTFYEDPQNAVDLPVGRLQRIVLKKPRVRRLSADQCPIVVRSLAMEDPLVEITYPVTIFYVNYSEAFEFCHYYSESTFDKMTHNPRMGLAVVSSRDVKRLSPWLQSMVPYDIEFLAQHEYQMT